MLKHVLFVPGRIHTPDHDQGQGHVDVAEGPDLVVAADTADLAVDPGVGPGTITAGTGPDLTAGAEVAAKALDTGEVHQKAKVKVDRQPVTDQNLPLQNNGAETLVQET